MSVSAEALALLALLVPVSLILFATRPVDVLETTPGLVLGPLGLLVRARQVAILEEAYDSNLAWQTDRNLHLRDPAVVGA